jgi:hypothetical protein
LNSSPARCGTVPTPGEANVTLPFLSLANAMNSAIDLAGDELGVRSKRGNVHTSVTGARSLSA